MIKRIRLNNDLEIVFSKNECGYQEVLDDFYNASYINILTYNISTRNPGLLELVNNLSHNVKVRVITNIPNRFATYYSYAARQKAAKNIRDYMGNLDPGSYVVNIASFFNFDNHSKIIMTNNFAYIGSENFSPESEYNYECGIIIKNQKAIQEIDKEIFSLIEQDSIQYHGSDITKLEILFTNVYSKLSVLYDSIHSAFYNVHDHHGNEVEYYDSYNTEVSILEMEDLEVLTFEIEDIISDFEDDDRFHNLLLSIGKNNIEIIRDLVAEESAICKVAKFDKQDYMNNFLQEHAMEAYDEYLNVYALKAADNASEILESLADEAEPYVIELENRLQKLNSELEFILDELTKMENDALQIDNT